MSFLSCYVIASIPSSNEFSYKQDIISRENVIENYLTILMFSRSRLHRAGPDVNKIILAILLVQWNQVYTDRIPVL